MKLGLINSAWAQAGRETAWGIQKTKELGFDTIEISSGFISIPIDDGGPARQSIPIRCSTSRSEWGQV